MNNVDWLDVVLDYGKRFPEVTMKDFGLIGFSDTSCIPLVNLIKQDEYMLGFHQYEYKVTFKNIFRFITDGCLCYWDCYMNWKPVPQHILLRLLTEGKGDLI